MSPRWKAYEQGLLQPRDLIRSSSITQYLKAPRRSLYYLTQAIAYSEELPPKTRYHYAWQMLMKINRPPRAGWGHIALIVLNQGARGFEDLLAIDYSGLSEDLAREVQATLEVIKGHPTKVYELGDRLLYGEAKAISNAD